MVNEGNGAEDRDEIGRLSLGVLTESAPIAEPKPTKTKTASSDDVIVVPEPETTTE